MQRLDTWFDGGSHPNWISLSWVEWRMARAAGSVWRDGARLRGNRFCMLIVDLTTSGWTRASFP
jgi:hypothetical protein